MFRGLISKIWPEQPGDPLGRQARERQAVAAGFWGMAVNLLLFASKLVVGLWANSIAVISDAFNNLSDLGSAVVAVFGANKQCLQIRASSWTWPHRVRGGLDRVVYHFLYGF